MPKQIPTATKQELTKAVQAIESHSSVEVVVAVQSRSASYLHIDLLAGIVLGVATLAFLLFSPWPFAWSYILMAPLAAGAFGAVAVSRIDSIHGWCSRSATQEKAVRRHARAKFVEQGVHHTRGRSGLLVFLSSLEGSCALVVDSAVELVIPKADLDALEEKLSQTMKLRGLSAVPEALAESAKLFAQHMPREEDDINELPDGVVS